MNPDDTDTTGMPEDLCEAIDRITGLFETDTSVPTHEQIKTSAFGFLDAALASARHKLNDEEIAAFDYVDVAIKEAEVSEERIIFNAVAQALEDGGAPSTLSIMLFFVVDAWRRENNLTTPQIALAMFAVGQIFQVEKHMQLQEQLSAMFGEDVPDIFTAENMTDVKAPEGQPIH